MNVLILVMRENTEWPEAMDAGIEWTLVGTERTTILHRVEGRLTDADAYRCTATATNPCGVSTVSQKIIPFLSRRPQSA